MSTGHDARIREPQAILIRDTRQIIERINFGWGIVSNWLAFKINQNLFSKAYYWLLAIELYRFEFGAQRRLFLFLVPFSSTNMSNDVGWSCMNYTWKHKHSRSSSSSSRYACDNRLSITETINFMYTQNERNRRNYAPINKFLLCQLIRLNRHNFGVQTKSLLFG